MLIEPPHYSEFYPNMSRIQWKSSHKLNFGWISGLYSVAHSSLHNIYGDFDAINLNPSKPWDFSELDFHHILKDSKGVIIYLAFWVLLALGFLIGGYYWCWKNRCCFCMCKCAKDPEYEPLDEEDGEKTKKKKKIPVTALVLSGFMTVLLIIFVVLIRYTFAANDQTNTAINDIDKDLNMSVRDINTYLETTRQQIGYTFQTCFWTLRDKIDNVIKHCTGTGCDYVRDKISEVVSGAVDTTSVYVVKHSTELNMALSNVQASLFKVEKQVKDHYEDTYKDVNSGLHGILMFFNIVYLGLFATILVGTVFSLFGFEKCVISTGLFMLRCSIVVMYTLGFTVILQLAAMFIVAGVTAEIVCPAVRRFESGQQSPVLQGHALQKRFIQLNSYQVPEYAAILQGCKEDQSAYNAFNLRQAYDVRNITTLTDAYFNIDINGLLSDVINRFQSVKAFPANALTGVTSQLSSAGGDLKDNLMSNLNKNPVVSSMTNINANQLGQLAAAAGNPSNINIVPSSLIANLVGNSKNMGSNFLSGLKGRFPRDKLVNGENSSQDGEEIFPQVELNPIDTVDEIKQQVQNYTHFVVESIEKELGKCKPAYDAINATINIFCEKIVAPVASFWMILQFMPPTFILIIVTTRCLQRAL